jgi:transposase
LLTAGQRHETIVFEALMEQGAVPLVGGGRPRLRPQRIVAQQKDNEIHRGKFNKQIYRERNRVERCFNRLKQFRRIATRYEKNAQNHLAMLTIAAIMLWL